MASQGPHPGNPGASFETLISGNAAWRANVDKDFFETSAKGLSPKVLWIGCADSRIPETVITGTKPGDILVQRNMANQFQLGDANTQSVLSHAVTHLKIKHVVVVGHSNCLACAGCLKASVTGADTVAEPRLPADAPLNVWFAPLVRFAWSLRQTSNQNLTLPAFVEANIRAQVDEVKRSSSILQNPDVQVHGWLYHLENGVLRDLEI